MVARARKEDESYEDYRENLKAEEELLASRLQGKFAHVSQDVVEVPNGEGGTNWKLVGLTRIGSFKNG